MDDKKAPAGGGGCCMFVFAIVNIAIGATVSFNLLCPTESIQKKLSRSSLFLNAF